MNVAPLGRACSVIVVDVSDGVLPQLSEYDPVTHDFNACQSFDSGLVLAIMLEPPCTTYSIIRRPALRSKSFPYGINPSDPQTLVGNPLASRACQVFCIAAINYVAAMLETPFSSLLKHLPFWLAASSLPCSHQVRVDSCRFGSPHLKSFRMLHAHLEACNIDRRCECCGPHLQVQGKYTKGSATYTDLLAEAIALEERARLSDDISQTGKGLENVGVREIGSRMHMDFDSALGYPGEGPFRFLPRSCLGSAFGSALSFCFLRLRLLCFFLCCFFVASWTSPLSGAI